MMMMINMLPTDHEAGISSSHGLSIVQQHAPRDPSIDKLSCYRRLHHGIDLSCVFYKSLSALYWVNNSTAASSSWTINPWMYINCLLLVYACFRFIYSVHIGCTLRMQLLILLVEKEEQVFLLPPLPAIIMLSMTAHRFIYGAYPQSYMSIP
jgi:hypothetical protein